MFSLVATWGIIREKKESNSEKKEERKKKERETKVLWKFWNQNTQKRIFVWMCVCVRIRIYPLCPQYQKGV